MKFKDIAVGARFVHNGTVYVKRSTRTAGWSPYRWFYFGMNEMISPNIVVNESYYGA